MRIRATQSLRTLPVVALSLVGIYFALRGRVAPAQVMTWALSLASTTLLRALISLYVLRHVDDDTPEWRTRGERLLWTTALLNSAVIGSSFWLVAAHGDLTVQLVMTLLSCFYAIGALVNASSHFPSFAAGLAIHLGQGLLFWLGVGWDGSARYEIAGPYLAITLLMAGFGADYSRQFRESIRMRTENVELLSRLESDKALIETALKEARLASESKSRFLAAASHDLRQPLHALTMFVSTLTFHVSTPDARRLLNRISDTTRVLEDQFESLLDLSRFEAGVIQVDVQPFRLDTLLERVADEVRADAQTKRLTLTCEAATCIARSDALLVTRVLQNLLQNAVKYTSSGSVTARVSSRENEFLVEVIDTGPGIPPDQRTRIFEEYVQLENPGRQRRYGVGLGLAIVRRIDALLDLKLHLASEVGQGSNFSFCLPCAEGDAVPTALTLPDVSGFTTAASIWILDDDANSRDALQEQFAAWGARVTAFESPDDLIAAYEQEPFRPAWIFADDMLGARLSGLDAAEQLRARFGHEKVCLITGNSNQARLRELRASRFPLLQKPTKPRDLIALLRGRES